MARFEDTPGLFGFGGGASTSREIKCGWCQTVHPESPDAEHTVGYLNFGDLEVAECCFEKVEKAVLAEMPQILPWFARMIAERKKATKDYEDIILEITRSLKK